MTWLYEDKLCCALYDARSSASACAWEATKLVRVQPLLIRSTTDGVHDEGPRRNARKRLPKRPMDVDDDGGQDIYEVTSQASYNGDGAESDISLSPSRYSYAPSRDGRSLFREIAGRKLNDTNGQYLLPSGEFRFNYDLISIYAMTC